MPEIHASALETKMIRSSRLMAQGGIENDSGTKAYFVVI
jgi:hypothetical protein